MRIPEYFAREQMETSRLPRAPVGIADVGAGIEAQAMTQAGGMLSQIAEKFQQAKDLTDVTEADTNALKGFSDLENQYVFDQDYGTIAKRWGKDVDKLRKTVLKKKGLSSTARRAIEQRFERDKVRFGSSIQSLVRRKQIQDGRAKYNEGLTAILKEGGELAESKAEALIVGTKTAGYITAEQAQADRENIPKMIEVYQIENLLYTNPAIVPEKIDAAKHLNPQEKNQLRSRATTAQSRLIAEQKAKYEQYVEQVEQDWLVKLRGHQLTENEIMASTLEVDKKQEWLKYVDAQAKEILAGEDIVTDEVTKGELESMAYDIFTGAISLSDFQKKLKDARYVDKTIDDNAYDEIFSLAQREYKTYQATAIKTAVDEAQMQLIDLPSDMSLADTIRSIRAELKGLKQKEEIERVLSERQLQFWHHGQYRRALNQWFADHPEATADEIYIESKKLLTHYRRREISEIKELLGEREKRLFTVSPDAEEMKKKYPEIWKAAEKVVGEGKVPPEPMDKYEYDAWSKVRKKWYQIPTALQLEIWAALNAGLRWPEIIEASDVKKYLE